MNAKTAKRLRKNALEIARAQNTQLNADKKEGTVQEIVAYAAYTEATERRKKHYIPLKDGEEFTSKCIQKPDGTKWKPVEISLGTVKLDPFCVKGIYRNLKRWYKRKERGGSYVGAAA